MVVHSLKWLRIQLYMRRMQFNPRSIALLAKTCTFRFIGGFFLEGNEKGNSGFQFFQRLFVDFDGIRKDFYYKIQLAAFIHCLSL